MNITQTEIIFYLFFSLMTILFGYLVFRVFVRSDYKRRKKLSLFSSLLEIFVFAAHANLAYTFLPAKWLTFPSLPKTGFQTTIGLFFAGSGLFFTIWAMIDLGLQKALGHKIDGLYQKRFYKYTRNPQIVAYGIFVLGIAIIWASLFSLGWVLVYFVIAHMMVRTEEEHLRQTYSHEYESYCRKVPRYFKIARQKTR